MNLIEHWGSGIPRIIEKVKAAGLREPEFIGGEVDLRVNIYRGQVESAGKVPENEQEKKIYEYVIETGNVRTVDVEALLVVGSRRARIILRKMVERGWLEKKGNSKNTVYIKCSTENEEVSNDKFYSEKNIKHLKQGMKALDLGKGVEHELIEEEDE